jgi:alpha-L-rhamnosidase
MGFAEVEIRPQLGPLESISGRMVHPSGWIEANLKRAGDRIEGTIELPEGVTGHFFGTKGTQVLSPGSQHVSA